MTKCVIIPRKTTGSRPHRLVYEPKMPKRPPPKIHNGCYKICAYEDVNTCNVHISWVSVPRKGLAFLMLLVNCTCIQSFFICMDAWAMVVDHRHSNYTSFLIQCQNVKHVSIHYDGVCCDVIRPDSARVETAL